VLQFLSKAENTEAKKEILASMAWAVSHSQIIRSHIPGEQTGRQYLKVLNEYVLTALLALIPRDRALLNDGMSYCPDMQTLSSTLYSDADAEAEGCQ
jgi:hypothetical protein